MRKRNCYRWKPTSFWWRSHHVISHMTLKVHSFKVHIFWTTCWIGLKLSTYFKSEVSQMKTDIIWLWWHQVTSHVTLKVHFLNDLSFELHVRLGWIFAYNSTKCVIDWNWQDMMMTSSRDAHIKLKMHSFNLHIFLKTSYWDETL